MSRDAVRLGSFLVLVLAGMAPLADPLSSAQNPTLLLSTRVAASQSLKTAMDAQRNLYIAGNIVGSPTGMSCVVKLTPSGAVVYTTCFEAKRFVSTYDFTCRIWIADLAVDNNGSAYITGCTTAVDFPLANPYSSKHQIGENVFVAKLDPSGGLVYSTYFGSGHLDHGTAIAADNNGNAYVGGWATGEGLPLVNAVATSGNGFIAKFDPSGARLVYSSYLPDYPRAITVDRSGAAYVVGPRSVRQLPTVRPIQACDDRGGDALIIKLTPTGSYDYVTCLGGSGSETAIDIAVDSSGSAYVVGTTSSIDFPTRRPLNIPPRTGAVWSSRDAGRTWSNLPLSTSTVYVLVPSRRQMGKWYAGTSGDGAFKTVDDGSTWRRLALPMRAGRYQPSVLRLVVSPHDSTTLYASTDQGFYKSTDDGEHWIETGVSLPFRGAYLRAIAVAPDDARIVYAASQQGFWKSVDGGVTWTTSDNGLGPVPYVHSLAVGDTGIVYVVVSRAGVDRVFVSGDAGAMWTPTAMHVRDLSPYALVAVGGSTVYFGADQVFSGGPFGTLFRTDDGGATWQSIGDGLPSLGPETLAVAPSDPSVVYVGARERLYVSSDRGASFAPVSGMTWKHWVDAIAVDPRDRLRVFVGTSGTSDAFVAKIAAGGASLEYSTYLGGSGSDEPQGIAIDDFGRAIVFGSTESMDFPNVAGLHNHRGRTDGFIAVLDGGGSVLLFSSVFGSAGADSIANAIPLGRQILFAGSTTDLASTFPGSGATGTGAFLALLDLAYGGLTTARVP